MTEYQQAVFEMDDIAKRLLERHGDDWKAALLEAAAAHFHFARSIRKALYEKATHDNWLVQAGNRAKIDLEFIEPQHRPVMARSKPYTEAEARRQMGGGY